MRMKQVHQGLSNRPRPSGTDMAGRDAGHPNPSQKRKRMEKGSSQILLGNINPRIVPVIDTSAGQSRSSGCQSLRVLVEHDVSLGLDELKRKGQV